MKGLATVLAVCVATLGLSRVAAAQAQETQRFDTSITVPGHLPGPVKGSPSDLFLTFSAPVEVPGVGLAPGAYVIRRVAAQVFQVVSRERSRPVAMFFAGRTFRNRATNDYTVALGKIRDGAPMRLVAWFGPGESYGYAPIYPAGSRRSEGTDRGSRYPGAGLITDGNSQNAEAASDMDVLDVSGVSVIAR
jgi:hypothetical protein